MKELNLNFSVDELNVILRALGKLPYMEVSALINKIHVQAKEQLEKGNGVSAHPETGLNSN